MAYYLAALAGLYVMGTLAVFSFMRVSGFAIPYHNVAWPPAWRQFDELRSRHYFMQGQAALAAGRITEARMSFGLAFQYNPRDFEIAFSLAQLAQSGEGGLSDRIYGDLLARYPEKAVEIARIWGRGILCRGDFARLARLAGERLRAEPSVNAGWLHALLFSARKLGHPALLASELKNPGLSSETRALLQLEMTALSGDVAGVATALAAPLTDSASVYARHFQIDFLVRTAAPRRGLELLAQYGEKLPPNERVTLSLDALAQLKASEELHRQVAALMRANPRPQLYEILAVHLIRHPDKRLLQEVCAGFETGAWAESADAMPANAALLCAAVVARQGELVARLSERFRRVTGTKANLLREAESAVAAESERRLLRRLLPALPMLPLETVYAIFERDTDIRRQP